MHDINIVRHNFGMKILFWPDQVNLVGSCSFCRVLPNKLVLAILCTCDVQDILQGTIRFIIHDVVVQVQNNGDVGFGRSKRSEEFAKDADDGT